MASALFYVGLLVQKPQNIEDQNNNNQQRARVGKEGYGNEE